MKQVGVKKCVMLTGDRQAAAQAVADELALDEVHAESCFRETKYLKLKLCCQVRKTKKNWHLSEMESMMRRYFPEQTSALRWGSMGSDAAIEAADVVLMDDDVRKIASVVKLQEKTLRIVKQNIVFALAVKALVLILGALGMANMWEAVFADVGVSVIAILNSMRR